MTTYIDGKAVGVGTIRAEIGVTGNVLHDDTLVGNGNTDPLGVNTANIVSQQTLANTISVLNTAIDAQAEAIAKTRNDFEVADQEIRADMNEKDSELEHMITEHAEELTTLRGNQASLGDQVSNIESKIPQSASGSNPLITKQQLLDEEMDIRDDYNELVSELQTQITAQAGAIAGKQDELVAGTGIKIDGNVISATGGGASGDYLPLSGGTLTGVLNFDYNSGPFDEKTLITFSTHKGSLNVIRTGQGGSGLIIEIPATSSGVKGRYQLAGSAFAPNNSGPKTLGTSLYGWENVYTKKLNNGADIAVPTSGGTMVVATPPTEDGSYVLKCVVVDSVPTVSWVKE